MTMIGDDLWHCAKIQDWQVASLPTVDSIYTLTCLSPITETAQSWLTYNSPATLASTYIELQKSLILQRALLFLSRFTISEKYVLNEDLKALGMKSAFSPMTARLEGIGSAGGNLYISRVIQDIYLSIDEKGIEGVAVTLAGASSTSVPPIIEFNQPFIIVVEHIETGTPVFLGLINNPKANS